MAKKTNKYWDERALRRLSDAEQLSEDHIKRIKKIYDKAFKDIDKEIANIYRNYSKDTGLDVQKLRELLSKKETDKTWKTLKRQGLDKYIKDNYKARISRLEQIQAQIYAKAKQIYPKEELEHTMAYKGVINDSYYKTVYDTQMGTGYDFAFTKIDENMEKALLKERWSGKNYSERIWGNTDILAESVSEIVGSGLLEGRSISKMSKDIRERFKVNKYYAERLIRTEVNHFNNEADAMAYEEMGVDMYVFVATLDNRTSEICQGMDGKKFAYKDKEEGVNFPPLHPNCRSKTRGYLGEEFEKTLKRRARNPITGKTELIDNMSYSEWAKKHGLEPKHKKQVATSVVKPVKTKDKVENIVKNDIKALTKDQKEALEYYVSGEGMYINNYLRSRAGVTPNDMLDIDKELVKQLDGATDRPANATRLYRSVDASVIFKDINDFKYDDLKGYLNYGTNNSYEAFKLHEIMQTKVDEFKDLGFVSTTKDYEVAKNWGDFTGSSKPVILELNLDDTVKGVDLDFLDVADDPQRETLLARNQIFKVKEVTAKDGNIYVKVDVTNGDVIKDTVKDTVKPVTKKLTTQELKNKMLSKYTGNDKLINTVIDNATVDETTNKIINNIDKLGNVKLSTGSGRSGFTPVINELKVKNMNDYKTFYHEWGHSIDYLTAYQKATDKNNFNWISNRLTDIRLELRTELKNGIPNSLIDILTEEQNKIMDNIKAEYVANGKLNELVKKAIDKKYGSNFLKVSENMQKYIIDDESKKELMKIFKKEIELDPTYKKWGAVSDIYDAITSGSAYNSKKLTMGHGSSYYNNHSLVSLSTEGKSVKENAEIFADYVELRLGNYTEQLDYLKKTSPKLVEELEKTYQEIADILEDL